MESLEERLRCTWERADQAIDRAELTVAEPDLSEVEIEAKVADLATERFMQSQRLGAAGLVRVQER